MNVVEAVVTVEVAVVTSRLIHRRRHQIRAAILMRLKAVVEGEMGIRSTDRIITITIIGALIRVALLTALIATTWKALLALTSIIGHITISRSVNHASEAI